jgi:hypothetical protein
MNNKSFNKSEIEAMKVPSITTNTFEISIQNMNIVNDLIYVAHNGIFKENMLKDFCIPKDFESKTFTDKFTNKTIMIIAEVLSRKINMNNISKYDHINKAIAIFALRLIRASLKFTGHIETDLNCINMLNFAVLIKSFRSFCSLVKVMSIAETCKLAEFISHKNMYLATLLMGDEFISLINETLWDSV